MSVKAERWALLLATLLHDVPWKPWIVTGALGGWEGLEARVRRECSKYARVVNARERNEREAQALIAWIACKLEELGARDAAEVLTSVASREWGRAIHDADVIASSIDRVVAPRLEPRSTRDSRIVNMFNPSLAWKHRVADYAQSVPKVVDKLLERMGELLALVVESCGADNTECILKRLYMALYSLIDVLWYEASEEVVKEPLVPVADTRVPHHTLFDHLRAAATALALRSRTVYALVDIPGVHAFVSAARKTRDYWSGSWLVSSLAWESVREIVASEGPQAVLIPSLQLNPFYLDMLASEVKGGGRSVEEFYPPLAWGELGEWPSQPVMPATISLILDGGEWSCDRLRKAVEDGVRRAWSRLWGSLREELEKLSEALERGESISSICGIDLNSVRTRPGSPAEAVKRLLCIYALQAAAKRVDGLELDEEAARRLLRALIEYLKTALKEPPLRPRVACVEVDYGRGGYQEFVKEVAEKLSKLRYEGKSVAELIENIVGKHMYLHEMLGRILRLVYARLELDKAALQESNTAPSYTAGVYGGVRGLWEAARGAPRPNAAYRHCTVCGRLPAVVRLPRPGDVIPLPGGGRLHVAENPEDERLVEERGGGLHVGLYTLQAYTGMLLDEGESLCPYCLLRRLLARYTSEIASRLYPSAKRARATGLHSTLYVANAWNEEEIVKALSDCLGVGRDEARGYFRDYADRALDLLRRMCTEPSYYRRVAVLYGDGDMIGSGYLRGVLIAVDLGWPEAKQALCEAHSVACSIAERMEVDDAGGVLRDELIPALVYNLRLQREAHGGVVDEAAAVALAGLTAAVTMVLRARGVLEHSDWPLTVIPSLSYLRSFSTSLMVSSLVDAVIVNALRGILVYAGGDDVLAVLPVAAPDAGKLMEELREKLRGVGASLDPGRLLSLLRLVPECSNPRLGVSVAMAALVLTRLNYWGLLGDAPGFHVYRGMVAQAVAAHGRSYGMNIVHFRTPLWEAFGAAYELMNVKDSVRAVRVSECSGEMRGVRKDYVIIGFEGGEVAVIPLYAGTIGDKLSGRLEPGEHTWLVAYVQLVYGRLGCNYYSMSLVYDALDPANATLASKLLHAEQDVGACRQSRRFEALAKLVKRIVARNRVGGLDELDKRVAEVLSMWTVVHTDSGRPEPLATHVFRGVRHLASGARR